MTESTRQGQGRPSRGSRSQGAGIPVTAALPADSEQGENPLASAALGGTAQEPVGLAAAPAGAKRGPRPPAASTTRRRDHSQEMCEVWPD